MVNGGQEGRLPQLLLPWLQEGKAARPARPGACGLPHLLRHQHLVGTSTPLPYQQSCFEWHPHYFKGFYETLPKYEESRCPA